MTASFHAARGGAAAAQKWVSGRVYGLDAIVWSPVNTLLYVRLVAGGGTTDPSADATNWALFGPTKPKAMRRGVIVIAGGSQALNTATLSPAVDVTKTRLRKGGQHTTGSDSLARDIDASLVLTNATTITATRGNVGAGDVYVPWELEELW